MEHRYEKPSAPIDREKGQGQNGIDSERGGAEKKLIGRAAGSKYH